MKKSILFFCILFCSMISILPRLKSQEIFYNSMLEGVIVSTDRNMYVSGEKIMFSAVVNSSNGNNNVEMSRVLYVELITSDGNRVTAGKFLAENHFSQGCLQIPEETSTGNYYLKSYTRWMRNGSTENYNYVRLKILHPSRAEIFHEGDESDTLGLPQKQLFIEKELDFELYSDKSEYKAGEKILIRFNASGMADTSLKFSLTMAPDASIGLHNSFEKTENAPLIISDADLQYYPELKGISLSGKLLDKHNGKALAGAKINLSVLGDKDIMVTGTDSSGRFFFSLPDYYGNRELFLSAENLKDISSEILIDNDFCIRPVKLPTPAFSLTQKEKEVALNLVVNYTIEKKFQNESILNQPENYDDSVAFYGEPSEVLMLENFVDLPSLEDYFNELPVMVKVRKQKGKKHFKFYTTQGEMSIFEPLVLIDWVAVNNVERVLAMPPREFARIELINAPYVKGSVVYGGIVSFISKKNDFAGIDLPGSGTFIRYRFLEECAQKSVKEPIESAQPDTRNTIYWNPEIVFGGEAMSEITLTAPETPGRYLLLLRSMPVNDEVKQRWIVIEVKASK